jgi:2-(3-amino-3-carboxypropyl)histidine synthase
MPNRPHINLLGTIQFRHALSEAQNLLRSEAYGYDTSIPQAKPLSPGEVLGCTSPALAKDDEMNDDNNMSRGSIVLFVADGRFHLESTMIANPHISHFYRYDPYSKTLTEESYQHEKMKAIRYQAIQQASRSSVNIFGIILGTLGRQGE